MRQGLEAERGNPPPFLPQTGLPAPQPEGIAPFLSTYT